MVRMENETVLCFGRESLENEMGQEQIVNLDSCAPTVSLRAGLYTIASK